MRAVVYEGIGRVAVRDVAEPRLQDAGDAIVRVTRAAICGSDLHFLHGKAPLEPGEVIGHEAVGIVERIGPGVRRVRVGDRVVASFVIACGGCWFCAAGESQLCEDLRMLGTGIFGGGLAGAQAELVRVPGADTNLLSIPAEIEDERALFVGDVLTTGFYGTAIAAIPAGGSVAIVGAGPVGFFCVQAARVHGAGAVFALDRVPERLALVERAGAVPIDVKERHAQMAVAERTEGRGADVVVEAVGTPDALETAIDVARRGGRVVVVGMYTGESVEAQVGVWWTRALDLRFAGICPVHAWWERALAEVGRGTIDPLPVVSHRLPLSEAARGYELFDAREATKVVLVP